MCLPTPLRIILDLSSDHYELQRCQPPRRYTRATPQDNSRSPRYYVVRPRSTHRRRGGIDDDNDEDDWYHATAKTTYCRGPRRARSPLSRAQTLEGLDKRVSVLEERAVMEDLAKTARVVEAASRSHCPSFAETWEYRGPLWIVERRPIFD